MLKNDVKIPRLIERKKERNNVLQFDRRIKKWKSIYSFWIGTARQARNTQRLKERKGKNEVEKEFSEQDKFEIRNLKFPLTSHEWVFCLRCPSSLCVCQQVASAVNSARKKRTFLATTLFGV